MKQRYRRGWAYTKSWHSRCRIRASGVTEVDASTVGEFVQRPHNPYCVRMTLVARWGNFAPLEQLHSPSRNVGPMYVRNPGSGGVRILRRCASEVPDACSACCVTRVRQVRNCCGDLVYSMHHHHFVSFDRLCGG